MELTQHLLESFSDSLIATGAVSPRGFVPGTTDEMQRRDMARRGVELTLTDELKLWWGWSDGLKLDYANSSRTSVGGIFDLLPFDACISHHLTYRDLHPNRFPVAGGLPGLISCDVITGEVHLWVPMGASKSTIPSLGELVALWTTAMNQGALAYNKGEASWALHPELIEISADLSPFVFGDYVGL